jgi:CRP-like cAMP-binding protein
MIANNPDAEIEQYVTDGQTDKAVEMLYKLSISSARKQDFINAEAYRERLLAIDSLALSTIIDINETIEREKSKAMTPGFRHLWAPFFKKLSDEEANAFFFALTKQTFQGETKVLAQGNPNHRLYLVQKGRLKVVYSDRNKEFMIHTLDPGDFFGQDTFFSLNVCSASVKTLTDVNVGYIERETLETMHSSFPALASKLEQVCCAGTSTFDRIRQKHLERRSFKRIKFNTLVSFQLETPEDQKTGEHPVKAELWDISKGGLCYFFYSKDRSAVEQLIGRKVKVRINLDDEKRPRVIAVPGVVHGVARHKFDEYSVHVKLERNFSDAAIRTIQNIATQ